MPVEGWGCWVHGEEPQQLLLDQEQRLASDQPLVDASRKMSWVGSWPGLSGRLQNGSVSGIAHVEVGLGVTFRPLAAPAPTQELVLALDPAPEPLEEPAVGTGARAAPEPEDGPP